MDAVLITFVSLTFLFGLLAYAFSRLPVRFGGESLRSDIDNLRTLLDTADESVMLLATDALLLEINETGMQRFGKRRDEMVGFNFLDFLPAERAERRRGAIASVTETRQPLAGEEWLDGRCLAWRLHPVVRGIRPIERIWLFVKDVTADRQLQAIEAVFRQFDQRLLRHQVNLRQLAQQLCQELIPLFALRAVWIARQETKGHLAFLAGAGQDVGAMAAVLLPEKDGEISGSLVHQARTLAEPVVIRAATPQWETLPESIRNSGSGLLVALPIYVSDTVLGVLTLHGPPKSDAALLALFDNISVIADHVSLAFEAAYDQSRLRLYEQALASTGTAVFITDRDGHISWVNEAFVRITGFSRHEVVGRTPKIFSSNKHDPCFFKDMWETLKSGQVWRADIINRRQDGSYYVAHQIISPLPGEDGEVSHFVCLLEDITDQKLAEERLNHLASHDPLTGLPNRLQFEQGLPRHLALASRNKQRCALMFVDLDDFKPVNDTHGHAVGDFVLKELARRLEKAVRLSDHVARFGGDEFVIVLPDIGSDEAASLVANKLLEACAEPVVFGSLKLYLSASIGIATYPEDSQDTQVLLKFADDAMYRAKLSGRNTYRFHSG